MIYVKYTCMGIQRALLILDLVLEKLTRRFFFVLFEVLHVAGFASPTSLFPFCVFCRGALATAGNGMTSATADRSASVTTMTSLRASFASLNGAGEGFGASPPAFGDGHPVEAEILESAAPLPRWGKTMTFVARMSISALAVVGSTAMAFAT